MRPLASIALLMLLAAFSATCARPSALNAPAPATGGPAERARAEAEAGPEPEVLKVPPPSGLLAVPQVPSTTSETLDNGFVVRTLERHGLPLVQLSLLIKSGRSSESGRTGVATLATELVKFGGAGTLSGSSLIDGFAKIGSDLNIEVSSDWTLFSTVTTHEHWPTALSLLAALTGKPHLPPDTFQALQERASERAKALALGNDDWALHWVLYRELFTAPTGIHPDARFDATASQFQQLALADCKAWLGEHFTPDNSELLIVGDVSSNEVAQRAHEAFSSWQGTRAAPLGASRPTGPERLKVYVIDRDAQDAQPRVDLLIGLLGAPRTSAAWPALSAAAHLLGGSTASRLYLDLVEARGLALRVESTLTPFAGGMPALIEVSAASEPEQTENCVEAILKQLARMADSPVKSEDLKLTTRSLVDGFLMRLGTRSALTKLLAERSVLELRDDYFEEYRQDLLGLTASTVQKTVAPYFDTTRAVLVVAGSAKTLAKPLSRFGPVDVLDAGKDFSIRKSLPHDPTRAH